MALFTPVNQIRLTNVAIVRLKKGGKRFELACYPNKVTAWRNKIETDLDEVLQIDNVFMNVSKGIVAKKEDLKKCFGTEDVKEVVREILTKGEMQVSEKERQVLNEKVFRDIATIVAEKCVNIETKRPLTVSIVERAMKEMHYSVAEKKSAKQQALEVIKLLKSKLPIERAHMRLKLVVDAKVASNLKEKIVQCGTLEKEETANEKLTMVLLIDPGMFRDVDELVAKKAQGTIEVLSLAVHEEGEAKIDHQDDKSKVITEKAPEKKEKLKVPEDEDKADTEEDEESSKPATKKNNRKGKKQKKKAAKTADSDKEEDIPKKPTKKEDDFSDEEVNPRSRAARHAMSKKKVQSDDEDTDEEPKKPSVAAKKSKASSKKQPVSDEDEDVQPTPAKPKKSEQKPKPKPAKSKANPADEHKSMFEKLQALQLNDE